jgi:hypothetical protein
LGVIAGLAALWLVAGTAQADDTHYNGVPIGAHAIALGRAFTGVADDASAAYFNPGGLALPGTHGIAGGLTINAWARVDLRQAFEHPDSTATATSKQGRTVPLFIGAVLKFGPKDALEEKKFALALSVLEPIYGNASVFVDFPEDPVALTDTYRVSGSDRATWYGLSFASRLDLKQSIGASLYLSVRKLRQSENGISLTGGMPIPDDPGGFVGTDTAANTQNLSFRTFHLVMRFGWLYQLKPQLQLGVMLQTPGIPIQQKVDMLSQGFANDVTDPAAAPVTQAYFVDVAVQAKLPIPGQLTAGLEYWPAAKVMLAFDASIYTPVGSGLRVKTQETVPIGGLFFDDDTARRFIGNVAIGGDFFITKKVMIETGFFTDLSSATNIPENPVRYQNPQINRFGGTVSLGLNVAGVALAVGSTFVYGRGDATGVVVDAGNGALGYTRTEAVSRAIYLHITGATKAAADLGDKTARGIKKRLAHKQREEAEEAAAAEEADAAEEAAAAEEADAAEEEAAAEEADAAKEPAAAENVKAPEGEPPTTD